MNNQPDQIGDIEETDVATPKRMATEEERKQDTRERLEERNNAKILSFNDLENSAFVDLVSWLRMIGSHGRIETSTLILRHEDKAHRITIRLYTDDNIYSISARLPGDRDGKKDLGYLGCMVAGRKARVGEDWNRGNDLADGKYNIETWIDIMGDIIGFELKELELDI